MKSIAERLREARSKAGISAHDLAAACGLHPGAVQAYESGERVPRDEVKIALAEHLGQRVQDLFF